MRTEKRWALPLHTVLKEKYEIEEVLGSGGFGITYAARDLVLEHRVAVKEFFLLGKTSREGGRVLAPAAFIGEFDAGKKRFKEEAALLYGEFDLPGICGVRDYFEENGTAYLVEEYLSGGTFADFLDRQSGHVIAFEECRKLFEPVLSGLCHIHALGIVHCDISPDNLMFTGEGTLKLIDFGAAGDAGLHDRFRPGAAEAADLHDGSRPGAAEAADLHGGSRFGKADYAPPEQFGNERMTGPWSDIYAVCAVMYQALTGIRPPAAAQRLQKDTLAPVSKYAVLPEKAEAALLQGLSLDIQKRYFYAGNLMSGLGMDASAAGPLLGKTRNVWGAQWLQMITEKPMEVGGISRRLLTGRQARRLLAVSGALLVIGGVFAGSFAIYAKTHLEEVFRYRLSQARKEAAAHPQERLLLEGDGDFDRILKAIEPYEREGDWQDEDYHSYDIPASVLKKLDFRNVGSYCSGKFYLTRETVKDILEYVLEQKLELKTSGYMALVAMERDDRYGRRSILNNSTQQDFYIYKDSSGQEYELELDMDPADGRVKSVSVSGNTETAEKVLRDVLPYLVPEIYLTDAEITDFLESSEEAFAGQGSLSDETVRVEEEINNHAKARIRLVTNVRADYACAKLTMEPNGIMPAQS